jgi:chromosomal replication initiation ATPase DnaA
LGSSDFIESTLKQAGEAYDRRMRIQFAGMDLSGLIAAICRYLNVDEKELAGPTRRPKIARARALVGYIATRELSMSGSEVARRLNVDRFAISRAVQRAENDTDLITAAGTILELLRP